MASIERSGTRTTAPRWSSASSARRRCASAAWAPAQMPAMPSWTVEGVFGIARTTGTPGPSDRSTTAVGIAAAIVSTVCSGEIEAADLAQENVEVLRLHGDHDQRGSARRLGVRERRADAVALLELVEAFGPAARGHEVARLSPARRADPRRAPRRSCPHRALRSCARRRACRSLGSDPPTAARTSRARSGSAPGTSPRFQPASRYAPARPCHSP